MWSEKIKWESYKTVGKWSCFGEECSKKDEGWKWVFQCLKEVTYPEDILFGLLKRSNGYRIEEDRDNIPLMVTTVSRST